MHSSVCEHRQNRNGDAPLPTPLEVCRTLLEDLAVDLHQQLESVEGEVVDLTAKETVSD
jgi:hypothetical protein